ncbi:MAG: hypothetical protein AAF125_10485, partial [Chloroflexota bacterium]
PGQNIGASHNLCPGILLPSSKVYWDCMIGRNFLRESMAVNRNFTIHQIQKRRIRSVLIDLVRETNLEELLALQNFIERSIGFDLPVIYII